MYNYVMHQYDFRPYFQTYELLRVMFYFRLALKKGSYYYHVYSLSRGLTILCVFPTIKHLKFMFYRGAYFGDGAGNLAPRATIDDLAQFFFGSMEGATYL